VVIDERAVDDECNVWGACIIHHNYDTKEKVLLALPLSSSSRVVLQVAECRAGRVVRAMCQARGFGPGPALSPEGRAASEASTNPRVLEI